MTDDGSLYRIEGRVYTYGELRDATMAEVADLPPETWRDGKFDFDDYLIESVLVGTIEECRRDLLQRCTHPPVENQRMWACSVECPAKSWPDPRPLA